MIGIYAQVNAAKIDRKKWEEVFEDCKIIAEAGQLADIESVTVREEELECLVPVREKDGKLHIVGDLVQGRCIQDCELERDVTKYILKGVKPLLGSRYRSICICAFITAQVSMRNTLCLISTPRPLVRVRISVCWQWRC
ncbi:MAG: hypothetical protein IKP95_05780 [Ruminococcus sp.]|nr:hypothetical protein [Ruminococcus sp.]